MNQEKLNDNNREFLLLVKEFIESYALNHDAMPLNEWLSSELQSHMPEKSPSEIESITHGIISSIELTQTKRESLDKAIKCGMTKEGWFAREVKKSENSQKLTQDLHNAAIHAQAEILGIDDVHADDNVHATPNETARQIENAAIMGSVIDAEFCDAAGEILNDNESQHSEFISQSLKSGNDTGIKAAAAGAIRSATEKKFIPVMSEDECSGVAYMATEKVKAAVNQLPYMKMIEEVERNAVSVTSSVMAKKGAAIGASIGKIFGPVGAVVGGIIGAGVGYAAGTKIGQVVEKKLHEVKERVNQTIETYVAPVFKRAVETVKSVGRKIVGWLFG
jgi:tetrahydromethanopterin S-methyltransferase subunit G